MEIVHKNFVKHRIKYNSNISILIVLFILFEIIIRNRISCFEAKKKSDIRLKIIDNNGYQVPYADSTAKELVSDLKCDLNSENELCKKQKNENNAEIKDQAPESSENWLSYSRNPVVFREERVDSNYSSTDEGRSAISKNRYEEIKILEKLQRIRDNKISDAPRGVQDQFIEMLGNSKFPKKKTKNSNFPRKTIIIFFLL